MKIPKTIKEILLKFGLYSSSHKLYVNLIKRKYLARLRLEKHLYGSFIGSGDLCFDVGANIGDKAAVFLSLGARVVAIDPQPYCVDILNARFSKHEGFVCVQAGVGEGIGEAVLYTKKDHVGAASIIPIKDDLDNKFMVNLTTLDRLIYEYGKPKFIKIDVEGYELSVLKGLSSPVDMISFEYHLTDEGRRCAIDCLRTLAELSNNNLQVNLISSLFFDNFQVDTEYNFFGAEWWDLESFIRFFESELPKIDSYFYGDIFVRLNQS